MSVAFAVVFVEAGEEVGGVEGVDGDGEFVRLSEVAHVEEGLDREVVEREAFGGKLFAALLFELGLCVR